MATTRYFTERELSAMKQRGFRGPNERRNRALFFVGILTGFRISELLSLKRRDVLESSGLIRQRITVEGRHMKGRKGRTKGRSVPLAPLGTVFLQSWLDEMDSLGFSLPDMPLWMNKKNMRQLSRKAVWLIYRTAARRAMISSDRIGTHSTRKTFAKMIYRDLWNQRDAGNKQIDPFRGTFKALGHVRMETTERYLDSVDDAVLQAAISRLNTTVGDL